ncbi:MAG: dihydrodipicolinate synthase family protein [Rhodospirillaceae bacterium TMED167]|nr:dihydrodipicolinate synthase family protein [Rhodospirillaceae bacterium]OUW24464.1 MAG: dihydrodipicolinate synthase family protein [Rhodospirillaceae bacterium TMED167]
MAALDGKTCRFSGVFAPVITPFGENFTPDAERLINHCRWLLSQGVGLSVFGTNSEANSLSADEKIDLMDALVGAGIDPRMMMPGTGCCAITETARLTAHANKLGCGGVLMLPPFYYKGVSDDGLFAAYSEVIQRVGAEDLSIYLYHIPPVANVPLSLDLIDRLVKEYPNTVVGIKDSGGDWNNTRAMLDQEWDDFRIFVGAETFLLDNMRHGGAGCISATANVNPAAIVRLYETWQDNDAADQQQQLDMVRDTFGKYVVIPALKACTGYFSGDARWDIVRPPLMPMGAEDKDRLVSDLNILGFGMPGLMSAMEAVA